MARDIEWASFAPGVRVGGSSTEQPAMASSGAVRMYEDTVEGNHCLVIAEKDKKPINVPWHMVGSFVYVPAAPAKATGKKPVEALP